MSECKFIRLAHEKGLGCGDTDEIEIVGDEDAGRERWGFVGPFKQMTFASRMQHKIYWGPLKKPLEWSLKTWLAPWSYIASVLYHDFYWLQRKSKKAMAECLRSDWGRLFQNWDSVDSSPEGFPEVGTDLPSFIRKPLALLKQALKILGTCIVEAPEMGILRRRKSGKG